MLPTPKPREDLRVSQVLYFAYGSNLDADQLRERCPSSNSRCAARLRNHRLDFTYYSTRWTGGAADVLPHSGDDVWGVVYELAERDLVRLDRYESGYERVTLSVEGPDGEHYAVITYMVREKRNFPPSDMYLDKILDWAERWNLPPDYLARLRQTRTS